MSTYTNIFGGNQVSPAFSSYANITLSANLQLQWPTSFQDTANVVASIMDVTPTGAGLTLTLPAVATNPSPPAAPAGIVSVGTNFIINNLATAYSLQLNTADNAPLLTIVPGTAYYIYLSDNTTVAGTWRKLPIALGASGPITSLTMTGDPSGSLTITPASITSSGGFSFMLSPNLDAVSGLATSGLVAYNSGTKTFSAVTLINGGNISITNPQGISGNPTIGLINPFVSPVTIGNIVLSGHTITTTPAHTNLNVGDGSQQVIFSANSIDSPQVLIAAGNVSSSGAPNYLTSNVSGIVKPAMTTGTYLINYTSLTGTADVIVGSCAPVGGTIYSFNPVTTSAIYPQATVYTYNMSVSPPVLADAAFTFMIC